MAKKKVILDAQKTADSDTEEPLRSLPNVEEDVDFEEGVYSKGEREELLEADELSDWEAGFMQGWDEAG